MSSRKNRLKAIIRWILKVRERRRKGSRKHVIIDALPCVDTPDSKTENATAAVPSNDSVPHVESLLNRKSSYIHLDEIMCCCSITTEGRPIQNEHVRKESTHELICNSPEAVGDLIEQSQSANSQKNDRNQFTRSHVKAHFIHSSSAPYVQSRVSTPPCVYEEKEFLAKNSPTGVTDLISLADEDSPPNDITDVSNDPAGKSKRGHFKYFFSRHKYDAQKANEAFIALKKELEKNEFTNAAQIIQETQSQEELISTSPLLESSGERKLKVSNEHHINTYEIIPTSPSDESIPASIHTDVLDNILGITSVVSQSNSIDSQGSDDSYYSSFDIESIGDITIDSTTQKLIEMHKIYCENAKVNRNHPARMKKSIMKVTSANPETETRRSLTWYDQGENLDKPFTLRTDESFYTVSIGSTRSFEGIHRSLEIVDQFLISLTKKGFNKVIGSLNCGVQHEGGI